MPDRYCIMVVDDEEAIRDAFGDALEDLPYAVETASSGKEALQKTQGGKVDLIFLDLKMPGMNGVEVLEQIREMDEAVPVYIVTAFHGEFLDRLQAAEDEGLTFQLLHKPIGQDAIRKVTTGVFGRSKAA